MTSTKRSYSHDSQCNALLVPAKPTVPELTTLYAKGKIANGHVKIYIFVSEN